ncbi:hypothetical protein [Thalassotalea agariperforans]
MNISTSNQIPAQLTQGVSGINNQQPVRKVEREREQNNGQQQTVQQPAREERFDVDQQALALVEQEYNAQAGQSNNANNAGQNQSTTAFDNPSRQNQTAVAAYESVDNQAKKAAVQQLFGVDLYA